MKNLIILTLLLNISFQIKAQGILFEKVLPLPPAPQYLTDFSGVGTSSIAFADIDEDNDQDVIIAGFNGPTIVTELYKNNGAGNYTLVTGTPFSGAQKGSIAFADIDGDNDQDIFITGFNTSGCISELYKNDGLGNYTLVTGTPFPGVQYSSSAFADIDGDNDLDLLITGYDNSYNTTSELFTNDGHGNFTLVVGTPFSSITAGYIAFADVDGDNDEDILITGYNINNIKISELYINDGIGNYTLATGTPFPGIGYSCISFVDVDNDNDQDVLITGINSSNINISELYINDGLGNYSLFSGTPFSGVDFSSTTFADIDGDNDKDLLITGSTNVGPISELYVNDGLGNFSLLTTSSMTGIYWGSVAFADIDGDNDKDLLITGQNSANNPISQLYINDGLGHYNLVIGLNISKVEYSSIAFTDVDGDNDQDVLITGQINTSNSISQLYINDGLGNYSLATSSFFTGVKNGSIAFEDVDSDNDQDVLITGLSNSNTKIAELYINDGTGNFTLNTGVSISGVANSSIAFSDIDGDSDQDLLITGLNNSNAKISELYKNDGLGNFILVTSSLFTGVQNSSIAFADIDGDIDQDILITGQNYFNTRISELYINDGLGNYSLILGTPFPGVQYSSIAFADIDGDMDQDLLITGEKTASNRISELYTNDGTGNFTNLSGTPFAKVQNSSVAFADLNGDHKPEILITGANIFGNPISELYVNNGLGVYNHVLGISFSEEKYGSVAFADIDGDNDQDVLLTGESKYGFKTTNLYRNISCIVDGIDTQVACDSFTWINNITYYASNNIATYVLITLDNCDSVVTLNLTINNSDTIDTIASACEQFNWYGITYTSSNDYTHVLTNINGCDSTIVLHLNIYSNTSDTLVAACGQFTWYGTTYSSSNNYTHILTNMHGCDSTVMLHLVINQPTVGVATVVDCGSHISPSGNYTWTTSGIYNDTILNSAGCDSVITINLIHTFNNTVTQNGVTLSSSTTGATYKWLDCNNSYATVSGETSQTFVATVNGSYAVEVTLNGCVDTSACYSVTTAGINSYIQSTYKLYPNPVNNELTIESQGEVNEIEIYNLTGQLLQTENPKSSIIKINFSAYQQGVYLIKVYTVDGQVYTSRAVKE